MENWTKTGLIQRFSATKRALAILYIMLFIVFLPMISAWEFDNVKETYNINDSIYPGIKIINAFGFGDTLWDGRLKSNTDVCGVNCGAEKEIILYEKGSLVNDIKFNILNSDGKREEGEIKGYHFYVNESVLVNIYDTVCDPTETLPNGTKSTNCYNAKVGEEYVEKWIVYKLGKELSAGTYKIKLEGRKSKSQNVDWVIKSQGIWMDEWAVWGNITAGDDAQVYLVSPDDNADLESPQDFQCNASVTGGSTLSNMSFWNNATGTWHINQTTSVGVTVLNERYRTGDDHSIDVKSNQWIAQGFSIGVTGTNQTINVNKIGIKLDQGTDSATLMNISIRMMDSAGKPTGTDLAVNDTIPLSSLPDVAGGEWFNITLNQTVELLNNQSYTIVARTNSLDYFYWRQDQTSPTYDGGNYSQDGGSGGTTWTLYDYDLMFEIYDLQTTATKEYMISNVDANSSFIWNCQGCDSDGDCGFAPQNRTVTLSKNPPNIIITHPEDVVDYHVSGDNLTLNWTISDPSLDTCWFYYNNTNTTLNCGLNTTMFNVSNYEDRTLIFYANDTYGLINSSTATWNYKVFENFQVYNTTVYEGSSESFVINMSYNSSTYGISAQLIYNNTGYSATKYGTGDNTIFTKILTIEDVGAETNMSFYWSFAVTDGGTSIINTTARNQTVKEVRIDDCSVYSHEIFNFTLRDEETKDEMNGTLYNSSIEITLTISPPADPSISISYSTNFSKNTNPKICMENLTFGHRIDGTISYTANDYVTEYYYLENYILENVSSKLPNNIGLYDLLTDDATSYLLTYQDCNYLVGKDKIIQVWRRYVEDGNYLLVEMTRTDENGQGVSHLVSEDIEYKYIVLEDGTIEWETETFRALCISTPCQISIKQTCDVDDFIDYTQEEDFVYTLTLTQSTRIVELSYTVPSGASGIVGLNVTQLDYLMNNTICAETQTGAGGTLSCTIPSTLNNRTYYVEVFKDGGFVTNAYFSLDTSAVEQFGVWGVVLSGFLILTFGLMFIATGWGVVIAALLGFIVSMVLSLVAFSWTTMIWLAVASAIIVWKISKKVGAG